jgi:hypothetical protein
MSNPERYSPFQVACEPRAHFRLLVYGVVLAILVSVRRLMAANGEPTEALFDRFPFLGGYMAELTTYLPHPLAIEDGPAWWQAAAHRWARGGDALPLQRLQRLPAGSLNVLLAAALVEEDSRFGDLFGYLQGTGGRCRPSIELLGRLLGQGDEPLADVWHACRSLLAAGLLEVVNHAYPRAEWQVAVPGTLQDILSGQFDGTGLEPFHYTPKERLTDLGQLILPAELRERLNRMPALLAAGGTQYVVIRGTAGGDRDQVIGALARAIGCDLLLAAHTAVEPEQLPRRLGPAAMLTGSLPVISCDVGAGETFQVQQLCGYSGPVGIILGESGGIALPSGAASVSIQVPRPGPALRAQYWQAAFPDRTAPDVESLSRQYLLPGAHIRTVAAWATAQAQLDGRETPGPADIRSACRSLNHQQLDTLAVRMELPGSWDQIALNPSVAEQLHELEQRCRFRERLANSLGPVFGGRSCGVRALLSGPSGTGKTLASTVLAASLDRDLYRVDLAAVINKYIGETEKNLDRVLSRAEELDVVLLLDEGDALLARRSEVRSSNDRYANLETNFLLQRLEAYYGIVLITTNANEMIDQAFHRRMDMVIDFGPPGAGERRQIWALHLPADHQVSAGFLEAVIQRCQLTGGQIRNVVLQAALRTQAGTRAQISSTDLEAALRKEYRKAGAVFPMLTEHQSAPPPATFLQLLEERRKR